MMKSKIVKTEFGWEPAFYWEDTREWVIEPGFAKPTRAEAQAALDRDTEESYRLDAADRSYRSGMDYACGYRD